jgi:hypothetical protein
MHKVLALIDRPSGGDECAAQAAQLAVERRADLILAVDPHHQAQKSLESELSHLVGVAAKRHAPTSTMLIDVEDTQAVIRAIRCNGVDIVVLERSSDRPDFATARVVDALREADIRVVPAR